MWSWSCPKIPGYVGIQGTGILTVSGLTLWDMEYSVELESGRTLYVGILKEIKEYIQICVHISLP